MVPDATAPEGGLPLAPIDLLGLLIVALLVVLGLWRGLWWQVIRLLGIVAAVALARAFSPGLAQGIADQWPELSPRLAHGVAWFAVFLGALGLATLLGVVGNRLLDALQLGLVNRTLGGVIGAVSGVVVHVAVLVVFCQLAPVKLVQSAVADTYSERLVDAVGKRWPVVLGAEASQELDRLLRSTRETLLAPGAPPAGPEGVRDDGPADGGSVVR